MSDSYTHILKNLNLLTILVSLLVLLSLTVLVTTSLNSLNNNKTSQADTSVSETGCIEWVSTPCHGSGCLDFFLADGREWQLTDESCKAEKDRTQPTPPPSNTCPRTSPTSQGCFGVAVNGVKGNCKCVRGTDPNHCACIPITKISQGGSCTDTSNCQDGLTCIDFICTNPPAPTPVNDAPEVPTLSPTPAPVVSTPTPQPVAVIPSPTPQPASKPIVTSPLNEILGNVLEGDGATCQNSLDCDSGFECINSTCQPRGEKSNTPPKPIAQNTQFKQLAQEYLSQQSSGTTTPEQTKALLEAYRTALNERAYIKQQNIVEASASNFTEEFSTAVKLSVVAQNQLTPIPAIFDTFKLIFNQSSQSTTSYMKVVTTSDGIEIDETPNALCPVNSNLNGNGICNNVPINTSPGAGVICVKPYDSEICASIGLRTQTENQPCLYNDSCQEGLFCVHSTDSNSDICLGIDETQGTESGPPTPPLPGNNN